MGIRGSTHYSGAMGQEALSGHLDEVSTLVVHAMVGSIANEKQSIVDVYEMTESLPPMLRERLDVESAVEILRKLYYIVWQETESFQWETGANDENNESRWKRLFNKEDHWFELAAHVQCKDKENMEVGVPGDGDAFRRVFCRGYCDGL